MRAAHLQEVKTITLDGLKPRWKVKKDDSVLVNGQAFVRVAPSNFTLCSLVAAKNELIPPTVKETSTPLLSFSKGLASLINLRNEKQSASLAVSPPTSPDFVSTDT